MATKSTPTAAPLSSYVSEERLFATRYKQGGRTVFSVALTPDQITNLIRQPDPNVLNPGNRQIRPAHAQSFADYYLETSDWVIPGIILRAPAIFQFEATTEIGDGSGSFGFVSYPKRAQDEIQILDGQHRILGFHLALRDLAAATEKARDHRSRALRTENGDATSLVVREAEAEIARLVALRERFYAERVSVEIQITDDPAQYRQMFFDIADNSLSMTKSLKARFDSRKVINRALPVILEHPLLANHVDMELDRLGQDSKWFLTALHVADISRTVIVGINGRMGRAMEKTLDDREVAATVSRFFTLLTRTFPQLKAIEDSTLEPNRLRKISLLGSPLMLRILAGTHFELINNHGFTEAQVAEFFQLIGPHMVGPLSEKSIFITQMPADSFNIGTSSPGGRRQEYTGAVDTLWQWAIDKPAFLHDEPAEPFVHPSAISASGAGGDLSPIDYSDITDSVEKARKLLEEDVALGITLAP